MKPVGVVRFLGTNCDRDVFQAVEWSGRTPQWLWFRDTFRWQDYSALIIPGGFSYGDYLRCGALAAKAPVMQSVREAAKQGVPVLGICNGFQILCESGLLPGVLVRNKGQRFKDQWVDLKLNSVNKYWSGESSKQARLPIAHGEGNYFIEGDHLKQLFDQNQVWWTYQVNPNGAVADIAGVSNKEGNVAALMPHPERAVKDWMGGSDGAHFFTHLPG